MPMNTAFRKRCECYPNPHCLKTLERLILHRLHSHLRSCSWAQKSHRRSEIANLRSNFEADYCRE